MNLLKKYCLALVLAVYFFLCLTGIFYNYGLNTVGDELPLMSATLKMISDQTLRPDYQSFYHVPFGAYLYLPFFVILLLFLRLSGAFTSLESLKEFGLLDFNKFLPFARFLTILSGLVSIYLVYKISEKLFKNKAISFFSATLLSSSLMFIQISHFAKVWIPQIMTILLALYLIVVLYQEEKEKFKNYILVGLAVGLAFGTHVVGVLVYIPFVIAHYFKNSGRKFKDIFLKNKFFWLVNLILVVFYFFIFYLNPTGFKNNISGSGILPDLSNIFHATSDLPVGQADSAVGPGLFYNYSFYARVLFEYEPLLILIFIFGAIALFKKEKRIFSLLFSFIFIYYFTISSIAHEPRYILPVIPFMALIAGFGLFYFYEKINHRLAAIIIAALIIFNYAPPLLWNNALIQTSQIVSARTWIYNNVAVGEKIINIGAPLELNESKEAINDINKFSSQLTKKRAYLMTLPEADYPKPNYYIFYNSYYDNIPKELLEKKYDYLIISWWDSADLKQKITKFNELNLKQKMVLLKKFPESASEGNLSVDLADFRYPVYNLLFDKISQNGPSIFIYKLN